MIHIEHFKQYAGTIRERHTLVTCGYRPYKCYQCTKPITKEEKHYNIAYCIPETSDNWRLPVIDEPYYAEILFHEKCFMDVAGLTYAMQITAVEYRTLDNEDPLP